jgi:hypothetical protein
VPASSNATVALAPAVSVPVVQPVPVAVWLTRSVFRQVTVSPASIVSSPGPKVKS